MASENIKQQPGKKIKEMFPYEYKKFSRLYLGIFIFLIIFIVICFIVLYIYHKDPLVLLGLIIPLFLLTICLYFIEAELSINSLILYENGIQPYVPKFNTPFIKKHGFIQFDELRRIRYRDENRTQFRIKLNAVDLFLKDNGPLRQYVDTEEDCMLIINTFENYKDQSKFS